jgi:acyl-CoA thioesterase FadM
VRAEDGTLLAEGETTHIVVNSKFEKTSLPDIYLNAFAASISE